MSPVATTPDEAGLVARLRDGDEAAFESLVATYYGTMLAVAQSYVRTRAVAEEVVQDAWVAVLSSIGRFEQRSSLKTWIVAIVVNTAKTRGVREARMVPFAALGDEPAVDPERFRGTADAYPGHWWDAPADWSRQPDEILSARETLQVVADAIGQLPEAQRTVIAMRDLAGCDADEVCATLDLTDGNQRVLLHRARSRVRAALEEHLDAA